MRFLRGRVGWAVVALAAAAAGGAAAAALLIGGGPAPPGLLPPGKAIVVSATITPRSVSFGDTIRARVDIRFDRRRIDPHRIRFSTNFAPYLRVGDDLADGRTVGAVTEIVSATDLRCLTSTCLVGGTRRRLQFSPVTVTYERRGGHRDVVSKQFPALFIASRLDLRQIQEGNPNEVPTWRAQTDLLPRATYGMPPGTLIAVLAAAAAALLLAAAVIGWRLLPESVRAYGRLGGRSLPPLERALALLERARGAGQEREERKALDLLARELRRRGAGELAGTARDLAWSRTAPATQETDALAGEVRRMLNGSTNGHRP